MRVAGSTLLHTRLDLETACRRLADLGFERVDVGTLEGWAHVDPSSVVGAVERTADRIESACASAGLDPVAFNAGLGDVSVEEQARRIDALARVGNDIGVDVITVGPGPTDEPLAADLDRFRALADAAEPHDVTLAVEGHLDRHTEDPAVALRYVESVPDLGFTLDPGHFAVGEHWEGGDGYDPLLPHVAHVHLRQARPGEIQVTAGGGRIDFGEVLAKLRDAGYDGALAVEYVDSLDEDVDAADAAAAAAALREELARRLAGER